MAGVHCLGKAICEPWPGATPAYRDALQSSPGCSAPVTALGAPSGASVSAFHAARLKMNSSMSMGLLHGLGLVFAEQKAEKKNTGPFLLSDLGLFPRSAKAISQVLRGEKNWYTATATLRKDLKDQVPFDPIGTWYHEGKEYAKYSIDELSEKVDAMELGEAIYFRLGVASALAKKPGVYEKLKIVLGSDYLPFVAYEESRDAT